MHCPNPQCNFEGYVQKGICPNCGEKLLPSAKLFKSAVQPKTIPAKIGEFFMNLIRCLLEAAALFAAFYAVSFALTYLYNMLCDEVPEWSPVDFDGPYMLYVKAAAAVLILLFEFKSRWRRL